MAHPGRDEDVVREVEVRVYTVPTTSPEADGTLAWDSTTMVLVRLRAGDAVGTGWTYGPRACADVVTDTLADVVRGRSVLEVTALQSSMVDAVRNMGRAGIAGMAISAVDLALWDLKARVLGVQLSRLLGPVREEVPVYGSGGFTTYDSGELATQLTGWCEAGITAVKIKIGESWGRRVERDLARMSEARSVVGEDVELFVDANGAYTPAQAVNVLGRATDLDVRWFEEPVTSDDVGGLRRVRDAVPADVAAGEYVYDLTGATRMVAAGAVDCLQLDVTRCGGVTEWLRGAAVAAGHHVPVSAHCAPALHVALGAAVPGFRHIEWFHDHVVIEGTFFDGFPNPSGGSVAPSEGPGHGLTLRESVAEQFRTA